MAATRRGFGSLRWRLLAAFLMVAVGAVALLALVAVISVDQRTAALAAGQRTQLRTQVADALAAAYTAGRGSWTPADLAGVRAIAGSHEMRVEIVDDAGNDVAGYSPGHDGWDLAGHPGADATHSGDGAHHGSTDSAPTGSSDHITPPASSPGHDRSPDAGGSGSVHGLQASTMATMQPVSLAVRPPAGAAGGGADTVAADAGTETVTVPIVVGGQQVGSARLTLPTAPDPTVAAARDALLHNVVVGAALAVALAAVAAAFVARWMSQPVAALTAATRAFAAGDPRAEQLVRTGPGELGDLATAFTSMAARVRRQDELRRSVVADVAHELRTPVTVLRGQTEALLDGIASPTPDTLVSLHDEVLRLERLTDDLATLSAADAAGLSLHTEPVDLGALVRRAVGSLATAFDDADVAVQVGVDDVVVDGDDTRLTQVVTNLLTNAAKFTPGGGTVTISVTQDGPDAVLTVEDTGPGIPAEELRHVFDRFWRGRSARPHRGTGIGLAVVDALVAAHGGSVRADSPPGAGARFTVRLRATVPHASQPPTRRGWRPGRPDDTADAAQTSQAGS